MFNEATMTLECPNNICTEDVCCKPTKCSNSGNNEEAHVCEDSGLMYDSSKGDEDCPRSGCSDETCCIKRAAATVSHAAGDGPPPGLPLWVIILIIVMVVLCIVIIVLLICCRSASKGSDADPGNADNVEMSDRTGAVHDYDDGFDPNKV